MPAAPKRSPFLEERHAALAHEVERFCAEHVKPIEHREDDVAALARGLLVSMGAAGLLRHAVPAPHGGPAEALDVRALCTIRETLAYHLGLADFVFAMQGLGSYPVVLAGTPAQQKHVLPLVAAGAWAAAFALTEPEAGSDAAALSTTARRDGAGWVLNGHKRFISNAPVFGSMVLFARTGEGPKGISAFVLHPDTAGLEIREQQPMAPHPLGEVLLHDVRLPADALLGAEGGGLKLALATLDVFRTTVAAAALGMARRAHDEAVAHVKARKQFGAPLAELQGVQFLLADNEVELDAARLLVERAAWTKDGGAAKVTREAAIAKLFATEAAQRVIDRSLQLHGGAGVVKGSAVERLYREIRALRIYEGATEVQKFVIARERLKA